MEPSIEFLDNPEQVEDPESKEFIESTEVPVSEE